MIKLIYECIHLRFRFLYLILRGLIYILQGKHSWNLLIAQLGMNKLENRLHLWQTVYFCLRTMPVKYAWKTPVWIYGKTNFYSLSGRVEPISSEDVYPGAVKIGLMDPTRSVSDANSLMITGVFRYGHNITIRQGAKWNVSGILTIKSHCMVADNVSFFASKSVTISSNCVIAFNSMFMDSDVHYMLNMETQTVSCNTKPIFIGEGCWLGGYTMVKKGTYLPSHVIVAGPYSFLCKDYSRVWTSNVIVGGNPIRILKTDFREINSGKWELFFNDYFKTHTEPYRYRGDIDNICLKFN